MTDDAFPDGCAELSGARPHNEADLGVLVVEVLVALADDAGDDELALRRNSIESQSDFQSSSTMQDSSTSLLKTPLKILLRFH